MSASRGGLALILLFCAPSAWAETPAPPAAPAESAPAPSPAPAPAAAPGDAAQSPPGEIILTPPVNPPPEPAPTEPTTPAPEPPPAAPPATEPQPEVPPTSTRSVQRAPEKPRDFNVELGLAMNGRLGEASGYRDNEGLGAAFGAGFWLAASERVALGLELLRADLGRASANNGQNFVTAEYASTALLLGARLFAFETQQTRLFAAIRVGLALEHVSAYGVRTNGSLLEPATAFDCSGTHGPAFALGAGLGGVVHLNSHLDFVGRFDGNVQQLTNDVVGGCAKGVGSAPTLSLGVGLAYGFDGPASQGDPFAGTKRALARR